DGAASVRSRLRQLLARVHEALVLEGVLAVVELAVAAAAREQLGVGAALDDAPALEHEDLVGRADGREAVRDHEGRAAAPQARERVLDVALALAVEARGGLVEDQDARLGQQRARDRDALALAAGELDAALADDRVVALLEAAHELVAVRRPARGLDL